MLKAGIIGLPNVGKSTLFNALVENAKAQAANFPFCTIEPNKGIVSVPDQRLQELGDLSSSQNIIPTKIEFVDIAGLVKGASKGEGLGNKFLSNIREVDAIVHVVRCFEDSDVIHVSGKVDPLDDIEIINLELNLADLSQLQKRRERIKKQVRTSKEAAKEDNLLEKIEDVGLLHALTKNSNAISLHIPWDIPNDIQEIKEAAIAQQLRFDAVNSNTFQDQVNQKHSYKYGSLSHVDKAVREQAIAHNKEVVQIGESLGSKSITIWLADGSNFPGQNNFQKAS